MDNQEELKRLIKENPHLLTKVTTVEEWDDGDDESIWDEIYKEETEG